MEIRHFAKSLTRQAGRLAVLGRNALGEPGDCDQARLIGSGSNNAKCQGCQCLLLAQSGHSTMSHLLSLLGVKRTWASAPHMSAFDPKRTFDPFQWSSLNRYDALS